MTTLVVESIVPSLSLRFILIEDLAHYGMFIIDYVVMNIHKIRNKEIYVFFIVDLYVIDYLFIL